MIMGQEEIFWDKRLLKALWIRWEKRWEEKRAMFSWLGC
jgi:hypothetical protein